MCLDPLVMAILGEQFSMASNLSFNILRTQLLVSLDYGEVYSTGDHDAGVAVLYSRGQEFQ